MTRWEVTLCTFKEGNNRIFKVTRRIPELKVSEALFFLTYEAAKEQFDKWLNK